MTPNQTTTKKEVVVSGVRPTGFLHLGNYLGALRQFVAMQDDYRCFFFVADWHALTTHPDTSELRENTLRVLAEYIACGLDVNKVTFYVQSQIPEIAELYYILSTLVYRGELEKTATFKEKIKLHKENINIGLLTYPILQAADILIHQATKVPVGKDQEQHLEMTRHFAQRFNQRYDYIFPSPHAFSLSEKLTKVLSLDGNGKMSKSENQMATLYLCDDDDTIRKKIMKAKTDSGPKEKDSDKPDYIENLFMMMRLTAPPQIVNQYEEQYQQACIRYGELKRNLVSYMINYLGPIREKAHEMLKDKNYLLDVISDGTHKAKQSALATMSKVREAIHLQYL